MPNKTNMIRFTYILKKITLTGKLPLAGVVLDSEAASGFLLCGGFFIGGLLK